MLKGEIAALGAAFLWALSTVLFAQLGRSISPLILNFAKGLIAIALIICTLLLRSTTVLNISDTAVIWLLLSGVIGIGFGDTAYFMAINYLGARQALLMESLAPPLTALIALIFLREALSGFAWLGIFLTLTGVVWVILERVPTESKRYKQRRRGIFFGILAVLAQAIGAVLSRLALEGTAVDPLASGLVRISAGVCVLLPILAIKGQFSRGIVSFRSAKLLVLVSLAAFLGTYLGIWLQQISFKYSPAGIAQALLATSPLFVLPIVALLGDRITGRALLGVLIALGGIWLLVNHS